METVSSPPVTLVELRRSSLVPPRWEDNVRAVDVSEFRAAGLSLAHAFAADDVARYLVTSDDMASLSAEDRWKVHVDIMCYITAAHCYSGLTTTIGPDYDGVALWLPPGKNLDDWWTILRSGLWRLNFQLSAEGKKRYDELLSLLHDTKLAVLGDRDADAWYLVYLGTKPAARRRGHAGKLLEHIIRKADVEDRPVYLESSSLPNNAYYQKFGFEHKRDVFLKRGRVPVRLSIMVREPRPAPKVAYRTPIQVSGPGSGKMKSSH